MNDSNDDLFSDNCFTLVQSQRDLRIEGAGDSPHTSFFSRLSKRAIQWLFSLGLVPPAPAPTVRVEEIVACPVKQNYSQMQAVNSEGFLKEAEDRLTKATLILPLCISSTGNFDPNAYGALLDLSDDSWKGIIIDKTESHYVVRIVEPVDNDDVAPHVLIPIHEIDSLISVKANVGSIVEVTAGEPIIKKHKNGGSVLARETGIRIADPPSLTQHQLAEIESDVANFEEFFTRESKF